MVPDIRNEIHMQLLPEAEMAAGAAVVFQKNWEIFLTFDSRHRPALS
jgi:hypothetical protein